jgi:hypothetical protein
VFTSTAYKSSCPLEHVRILENQKFGRALGTTRQGLQYTWTSHQCKGRYDSKGESYEEEVREVKL